MEVTSATQTAGTAATRTSGAASGLIDSDFQTFLVMLTTQMKNQNPLNPIEASDYAVQLATFSGVEQQVQTNDLLQNLVAQMSTMGMGQMAGWVGMEARAAAPAWFDGHSLTLAPNPPTLADEVKLVVYDALGREVARRPLAVGTDTVEWNGLTESGEILPVGQYTFRLEAYVNGKQIANNVMEVYSRITEVRGENGGTAIVLKGGAKVAAGDITALRQPAD